MGASPVLNRKPALSAAKARDQVDESPKTPEEDGDSGSRLLRRSRNVFRMMVACTKSSRIEHAREFVHWVSRSASM